MSQITAAYTPEPVVPRRHPGRWVAAGVILLILAMIVQFFLTTEALRLDLVGRYLFDSTILSGVLLTIELTVLAMVIGIVLGIPLAVFRLSKNPVLQGFSSAWIWVFRGTPILVQLLFWFFLGTILPRLSLGIPFTDVTFWSTPTNQIITQLGAAVLGLGLNEAAYTAETIRAGIQAVPKGQVEAAKALGMTEGQSLTRIVLPQAARVAIPPLGNQVISMLKLTSMVVVIGLPDLLTSAQIIYSRNFQQIPLLIVASIWYLLLTTVLTMIQSRIEKRLAYRPVGAAAPKPAPAQEMASTNG